MKVGKGKRKFHQGYFVPRMPEKYVGDLRSIIYRSGWEQKFMGWCDFNENVVQWSSEPFPISYHFPIDNKIHRYWVDFWIRNNRDEKILIEVKPYKQTLQPVLKESQQYQTKKVNQYKKDMVVWIKNQSKWQAAKAYTDSLGWKFRIVTEKDLHLK